MRISDWSSDVCSSDLLPVVLHFHGWPARLGVAHMNVRDGSAFFRCLEWRIRNFFWRDWKSVMLLRCGEIAGHSAADDDLLLHDIDVCPVDRRKVILLIRRTPANPAYHTISR